MALENLDQKGGEPTVTYSGRTERDAFGKTYATLSPVLYGIISRIVQNDAVAAEALEAAFLCMYQKGVAVSARPWQLHLLLPIVFECVEKALHKRLPAHNIKARIASEKKRLLHGAASAVASPGL